MNTTSEEIDRFVNDVSFSTVENEDALNYNDPFVTEQQKLRDKYITQLLSAYVASYQNKVKLNQICRYAIMFPCIGIIVIFAILLVVLFWNVIHTTSVMATQDLVAFVTACVSFISLIIGLLTIITKYFFPENDEQYITTIVESIQRNDLENKRENARYKHEDSPDNSNNH